MLSFESLEERQLLTVQAWSVVPASSAYFTPTGQPTVEAWHGANGTPLGTTGPNGFTPAQLRHAYGFDQITFSNGTIQGNGTGQTIAIIDAYDTPTIAAELAAFDAALGLAAPPSFKRVAQDGSTNYPSTDSSGPGTNNWELETALDVEWAHALAPGANILLVEAATNSFTDLISISVNYARRQPGVAIVSMSFGALEFSVETSFDSTFTTPNGHAGVTFVASTGDSGTPAEYPAFSPNVVGIGGTSLSLNASNNIISESAWSGSGGGTSSFESQPSYQNGVVTQSITKRTTPDVAFDANPNSGVAVYDSYNNGTSAPWVKVGGTSLSAPSWSALLAIADQGRAAAGLSSLDGSSQTLPKLYALPSSDFNDITTGSNNTYTAGVGYDLVTGRGSPKANFVVADLASTSSSLWPTSPTPAIVDSGDSQAVELGVKFTSDTNGWLTGLRFYKSAANTGTHVANLWTANGQLLVTATFAGETSSGWQQANFASPVAVTAGTTYVASYHTTMGHYSVSRSYFTSQYNNAPLHAPVNGGVYLYGMGGFPTNSFQASNYWVDVVLSTTPPSDTTPPTVTMFAPASGASNVATNTTATVTFSEAMNASTVTAGTVFLRDANNVVVSTSVVYNSSTHVVTLTPSSALANSTAYTIVVESGSAGVKDLAGNALVADATSSFTTAAISTSSSLWPTSPTPAIVDSGDSQAVELGVKFTSDTNGWLTGLRFYKSAANTGTHVANLWTANGQLLVTATFAGETSSGWQQANFASPVAVTAGTTYVASYHTTMGHYSVSRSYFTSQYNNVPLHAPVNGGVYLYGTGGFPTNSFQASNYWVDVVLSSNGNAIVASAVQATNAQVNCNDLHKTVLASYTAVARRAAIPNCFADSRWLAILPSDPEI